MRNKTIILVNDLTKYFFPVPQLKEFFRFKPVRRAPFKALENISFQLLEGQILGILGPNGAGKTTLLKCLSTVIIQDKGQIFINNRDLTKSPFQVKKDIGFVLADERSFYWRLTGKANLEFFAAMYGMSKADSKNRIKELLALFDVDYADKRFDSYSTGMKRKFALIRALLHKPKILFIDELTKSLDLETTSMFDKYISSLANQKTTIILTSHNIIQMEHLCDTFIFLNKGKIITSGNLGQIQAQYNMPRANLTQIYKAVQDNA
jgi:ABC-type multidrug transport system ATPase subunit